MDSAPASKPARPVNKIVCTSTPAAPIPSTRARLLTRPSFAPKTAADAAAYLKSRDLPFVKVGITDVDGILVAPGEFYGPRGSHHVRVALTATDERITAAVQRLTA